MSYRQFLHNTPEADSLDALARANLSLYFI